MKGKPSFLLCGILTLALGVSAQAMVLSDFEGNQGGWYTNDWTNGTIAQSTIGASEGSGALRVDAAGEWKLACYYNLKPIRTTLGQDGATFSLDVTAFAADMATTWLNVGLVINAPGNDDYGANNNIGWNDLGQQPVALDGQPHTLTFPLSAALIAKLAGVTDNIGWYELGLTSNVDAASVTRFYIDNVQLTTADDVVDHTYGVQVSDWENSTDGWVFPDGTPAEATMAYSTTTGVTSNTYSLKVTYPDTGWQGISLDLMANPGIMDLWRKGSRMRVDVTRLAAEWPAGIGWSELTFIVNTGGDGWSFYDTALMAGWNPSQGDDIRVLEWDYTAQKAKIQWDNLWWLQILILSNSGPAQGSPIVLYYDNFEVVLDRGASQPSPADAATQVSPTANLSWTPGVAAVTHDVYFGTEKAAVRDATPATAGTYPGLVYQNVGVSAFDPGTLEMGTTYYWRVDEVNGVDLWKGAVWRFTTGHFRVIDDFEDYDDVCRRVFYVWKDGLGYGGNFPCSVDAYGGNGTGSIVGNAQAPFAEQTLVHGGRQSMPYLYNTSGGHAEAVAAVSGPLSLGITNDWTADGVRVMSLWFLGHALNNPEQMFIKLEDGDVPSHSAVVAYTGGASAVTVAEWQNWTITLTQFAGVNLTNVARMSIGFGTIGSPSSPAAIGMVYFDDIRLLPAECILAQRDADFAKADFMPIGEVSGDCRVDGKELEVLVSQWLAEGQGIATVNPGTNGLAARYPLSEGTGTTTADTSGNGRTGTILGSPTWIDGMAGFGKALRFTGTGGDVVDTGTWNPSAATGQLTAAAWIKWSGLNNGYQGLISKRDDWSGTATMWSIELNNATGNIGFLRYDSYPGFGFNVPPVGLWQHVAVTFDGAITTMYIDGQSVGTSDVFSFGPATGAHLVIGAIDGNGNNPFNGVVDEVNIFSRALSAAEVAYLADKTPGDGELYNGSPADLHDPAGRKIDFKDFAVLAAHWLEQQLWPR